MTDSATRRDPISAPLSRSSRRALIAGALGGLGAWAAGVIGRAAPVRAEGENIVVGGEYLTAQSQTLIRNQTNGSAVFSAQSWSSGLAIYGKSDSGTGVYGESFSGNGLVGVSNTQSALNAVSAALTQPAVLGLATGHSTAILGASGSLTPLNVAKTGSTVTRWRTAAAAG